MTRDKNFKQFNFLNYKLFSIHTYRKLICQADENCTYLKHQYLPRPEE